MSWGDLKVIGYIMWMMAIIFVACMAPKWVAAGFVGFSGVGLPLSMYLGRSKDEDKKVD